VIGIVVTLGALALIGYLLLGRPAPARQFVTVEKGSVSETVSVSGNTTPMASVSLGFGSGGTISHVYGTVGTKVAKGQLLAQLDTSDLAAQVKQAQANVDTQKAKLAGLKEGARPEDIAASQASLDKTKQDLANLYASIPDISIDSYSKANDAVRVQLDPLFSNAETTSARLTYITSSGQAAINATAERISVSGALNTWQAAIAQSDRSPAALDTLVSKGISDLAAVRSLLSDISATLDGAPGLTPSTLASYKSAVTAAQSEVNTASKNLNTVAQNIASQKLTIAQAQAQLDLTRAGTSASDISAQEAQVESAEANLESIQAKYSNAQIVAPISGVVTQFDAKVGQTASPGATLISIISQNSFEVDALVSEIDVGKLAVGNTVSMTLDAFPDETFKGSVFFIDPAQTTSEGVVGYKIKVSFDSSDSRMKSGLTANLDIETRHKDDVLILPQYAIVQGDDGAYVEVMEDGVVTHVPVTLGLQDQEGNVEVVSGVTEGQQVLNIGLKQK
jgi:HlyD family secretion protein